MKSWCGDPEHTLGNLVLVIASNHESAIRILRDEPGYDWFFIAPNRLAARRTVGLGPNAMPFYMDDDGWIGPSSVQKMI